MKKFLFVLVSLLVIINLLIFIFLPGKLLIKESRTVNTTSIGFDTCLHKLEKWKQWWPGHGNPAGNDSFFVYDNQFYKLSNLYTDGGIIEIKSGKKMVQSRIQTLFIDRDSILAEWRTQLQAGNNPIARVLNYLLARKIKKSMQVIFDSLCHFADKTENIYGYHIERTTFTEVTLIANRFKSEVYPTTTEIYNAVNRLRQYLISQGTKEKYYPMMNIKRIDSSHFETMVAISIEKLIPANKDYFISQMVAMKDRFLTTDVTGGPGSIEKAKKRIEKYMEDHSLSAPARPFEILVTDRSKETDTAAWKTKIFFPSM
jgi:effector-binding domain-containing protein